MNHQEIKQLYNLPFFDLIDKSRNTHKKHWDEIGKSKMQLCTLLSIKTGGCSEDCVYCAQSARYGKNSDIHSLMDPNEVIEKAKQAKDSGSDRFCMGAAWKGVRKGTKNFDKVLQIVKGVSDMGMEVCVTLGEIGETEAKLLKKNGVSVYNHNIDTSEDFYDKIVSTHTFKDRINTIKNVQKAGMEVCCGGILGLGESVDDRLKMLHTLSNLDPQPESVPINMLTPMPGTPLENNDPIDFFEVVRIIAVTRICMPKSKIRLSAGRKSLSDESQSLCYYAGANSIFFGDKLLTAKNPTESDDYALLKKLNLLNK